MKNTNGMISALLVAAAIAAPVMVVTGADAQEATVQVRVYDRDHRDYHNWDDHEDRAYEITWPSNTETTANITSRTAGNRNIIGTGATVIQTTISSR